MKTIGDMITALILFIENNTTAAKSLMKKPPGKRYVIEYVLTLHLVLAYVFPRYTDAASNRHFKCSKNLFYLEF